MEGGGVCESLSRTEPNCSCKVSLYNMFISVIFATDIPEGGKFSISEIAMALVQSHTIPWIVAIY